MDYFVGLPTQHLRVSSHGHRFACWRLFWCLDLSKFGLELRYRLFKDSKQLLGMLWADRDNRLGLCLIEIWDLVEEEEGELIILEGDLDHIAIYWIKFPGDVYSDLL